MDYEYRVVPAPRRLRKIKGVSSPADLFATTLADAINAEARSGWEYVGIETHAAETPGGWLRRAATVEETVMIFRRPRSDAGREPSLRELPTREPGPAEATGPEPHSVAALRTNAAPERSRALASVFARGDSPSAEGKPPQNGASPNTPQLLRPVPRHKPGDKT